MSDNGEIASLGKTLTKLSETIDWSTFQTAKSFFSMYPLFRETNGKFKPSCKLMLTLKLLGFRPVLTLTILSYAQKQNEGFIRAELAKYLEAEFAKGFSSGSLNNDLGKILNSLVLLNLLREDSGRFFPQDFDFQISSKSIADILFEVPFQPTRTELVNAFQFMNVRIGKITDYDGRIIDFKCSRIIESIILSGGTWEKAIETLEKSINYLTPNMDKTSLQFVIYKVLKEVDPPIAEHYLINYPVRLFVKNSQEEAIAITMSTLDDTLVLDSLRSNCGIIYIPKASRRKIAAIVYEAFYEQPTSEIASGSTIDKITFAKEIDRAIFNVYGKDLRDIINDKQGHLRRAIYQIEEAKRTLKIAFSTRDNQMLRTRRFGKAINLTILATSNLFQSILLSNKILPPPERNTDSYSSVISVFETILAQNGGKRRLQQASDILRVFLEQRVENAIEETGRHCTRIRELKKFENESRKIDTLSIEKCLQYVDNLASKCAIEETIS